MAFFFRMIFRIILNWQLLAGPTDADVHHTGPAVYWQLVQQIMISHYATREVNAQHSVNVRDILTRTLVIVFISTVIND